MPAFLEQLVKVLFEAAFHAFPQVIATDRMIMFNIGSFLSKAGTGLRTAGKRYLAFRARIIRWSIG